MEQLAELENPPPSIEQRLGEGEQRAGLPSGELLRWYSDDLANLADMADEQLARAVADYIRHRDFYRRGLATETPTTCGACIHSQRTDHPNLGHCAEGQRESAAGLWDTTPRWCNKFQQRDEVAT